MLVMHALLDKGTTLKKLSLFSFERLLLKFELPTPLCIANCVVAKLHYMHRETRVLIINSDYKR